MVYPREWVEANFRKQSVYIQIEYIEWIMNGWKQDTQIVTIGLHGSLYLGKHYKYVDVPSI